MMSGTNVSRGRLMREAPYDVQPFALRAPTKAQGARSLKQKRKSHLAVACCVNTGCGAVPSFFRTESWSLSEKTW
jgi:hypothetical protein